MFTRQETKDLTAALREHLKAFEAKHNVKVGTGSIRYGDDITTKLTINKVITQKDGTAVAQSKEAKNFKNMHSVIGISHLILGQEFKYKGSTYVITGYNTRAPKMPVQFTVNGEPKKSSVNYIRNVVEAALPEYTV